MFFWGVRVWEFRVHFGQAHKETWAFFAIDNHRKCYPKGSCAQNILWPASCTVLGALGPKYIPA